MGHWHGEISRNVTFAYCTKGCIDVAVLRGRPLTHVRSLSMQNLNPFIALFLSFFLHENSQRGYIRVRKLGCLKTDTHSQRRERRLQENALAWGRRVLRHQPAQLFASSCIMTCFLCAAMAFRYSTRARISFT